MAKLWQKDTDLNALMEAFTVGRDYLLDLELLPSDCLASMAQARQLRRLGLVTSEEEGCLHRALNEAYDLSLERQLRIRPQDEDGHTVLESFLIQRCGDAGKKIHTGRSRNDQVITALRVYGRHRLLELELLLRDLIHEFLVFARSHEKVPMPGRTHLQIAMPSSVGLWAAAWAEELLDWGQLVSQARQLFDRGSLGAAASYGSPLPLDRKYTSEALGFARPQNNVLAVNNSRGRCESVALDALDQVGITLSKWAQDLILFTLPELGYFELPAQLCSGSSIMPQKKNPDGLELLRSRSAVLSGYAATVKNIVRSLPSGYNRDFQDTKEPFLRSLELADLSLRIARLTMKELVVHEDRLRESFTPEIYATDAAFELVLQGVPFRDAYQQVGRNLDQLKRRHPEDALQTRTHLGGCANLGLEDTEARLCEWSREAEQRLAEVLNSLSALAGRPIDTVIPTQDVAVSD